MEGELGLKTGRSASVSFRVKGGSMVTEAARLQVVVKAWGDREVGVLGEQGCRSNRDECGRPCRLPPGAVMIIPHASVVGCGAVFTHASRTPLCLTFRIKPFKQEDFWWFFCLSSTLPSVTAHTAADTGHWISRPLFLSHETHSQP